jgi:type IV pilus assembly protein PilE
MKTRNLISKQGFTIIELMIVLVIVAILLGLAYPSYVDYVRKGKRGDAQQILMNWSVNQEIWRSNNPTYAADTITPGNTDYYSFTIDSVTATSYNLQADAQGDQVNDKARDGTSCAQLNLNQNGQKTPAACWE